PGPLPSTSASTLNRLVPSTPSLTVSSTVTTSLSSSTSSKSSLTTPPSLSSPSTALSSIPSSPQSIIPSQTTSTARTTISDGSDPTKEQKTAPGPGRGATESTLSITLDTIYPTRETAMSRIRSSTTGHALAEERRWHLSRAPKRRRLLSEFRIRQRPAKKERRCRVSRHRLRKVSRSQSRHPARTATRLCSL
ncbi:hypothetical protein PMAYCL1PPCAC_24618, partial [Pristionchus mayeri]